MLHHFANSLRRRRKEERRREKKEKSKKKEKEERKEEKREKKKIRDETDLVSKIGGRDRASDFVIISFD